MKGEHAALLLGGPKDGTLWMRPPGARDDLVIHHHLPVSITCSVEPEDAPLELSTSVYRLYDYLPPAKDAKGRDVFLYVEKGSLGQNVEIGMSQVLGMLMNNYRPIRGREW